MANPMLGSNYNPIVRKEVKIKIIVKNKIFRLKRDILVKNKKMVKMEILKLSEKGVKLHIFPCKNEFLARFLEQHLQFFLQVLLRKSI